MSASRNRGLLALLPLLLLAFGLRAYHLDFQSFWSDEGISLLRVSQPLGQMLRVMPVEHAPGYFVLLHFWVRVAGESDYALRFLSLWPSVLAVALVYRLGADLGSRLAGLAAGLLLATNAFQVWYGQEARMYSWLLATGLAATWLLWRLFDGSAGRRGPAGVAGRAPSPLLYGVYALLIAATIYLHYYGFLVPAAHALFVAGWLWQARARGCDGRRSLAAVLRWAIAGAAAALLFLPWLPRFVELFGFSGWRAPQDPRALPWRALTAYTVGDTMPAPGRSWLPWVYLLLALGGAATWWFRRRAAALLALSAAFLPLAGAVALALRQPDFHERYTIVVSAPLLLLAGFGIAALAGRGRGRARPATTALAGLLLIGLAGANGQALQQLYTNERTHKPDFRDAARRIEQLAQPGDVILVDGPDPEKVFRHYYRGNAPVHDLRSLAGAGEDEVAATLAAATAGAGRAWGLLYFHDPGPVQAWLAEHGWPTQQSDHNGIRLTLYGLPTTKPVTIPLGVAFGPELTLASASVGGPGIEQAAGAPLALRAGELLRVTTRWEVAAPPPGRKFSLRLRDAAGRVWVAEDYVPQDGFAPTERWVPGEPAVDRHGLLLPPDLPPGRYDLTLRLYDPATGAAVETASGADVPLAAIEVLPHLSAPDPSALPIPTRLDLALDDRLTVLGFDVTPRPLRPGHEGTLTLWWQATGEAIDGYRLRVELAGDGGRLAAQATSPLALSAPAQWEAGQIVRERYPLALAPTADCPDGGLGALWARLKPGPEEKRCSYRLILTLLDSSGTPLGAPATLGPVEVGVRSRTYRLPRIARPLEATLGEEIALRGYDLALPDGAGDDLGLTLYWQATKQVSGRYKVFVHLVDAAGRIVTQSDAVPSGGAAPTESWLPNEVIRDTHRLALPGGEGGTPPEPYRLLVGMYDPESGSRLPARDATGSPVPDDAIPLGEIALP